MEIWKKDRVEAEQKNKVFIKKLQDDNKELKGSTSCLKSQNEKLQNVRHKAKIQETIERKWTKSLFLHKKQHETLDNQVKAITKERRRRRMFSQIWNR